MDRIATEIHQRAAGQRPLIANVILAAQRSDEFGLDSPHRPDATACDALPYRGDHRVVSIVHRLGKHLRRSPTRRLDQRFDLARIGAYGLLDEHMLACIQCSQRPTQMIGIGQSNVNRVNFRMPDQGVVVMRDSRNAVLESIGARAHWIACGHHGHGQISAPARGMDQRARRDPRRAQDAESNHGDQYKRPKHSH